MTSHMSRLLWTEIWLLEVAMAPSSVLKHRSYKKILDMISKTPRNLMQGKDIFAWFNRQIHFSFFFLLAYYILTKADLPKTSMFLNHQTTFTYNFPVPANSSGSLVGDLHLAKLNGLRNVLILSGPSAVGSTATHTIRFGTWPSVSWSFSVFVSPWFS